MGIIAFLIIGLIAGLIARAIVPGRQSMGVVGTIILGMVGSVVGGIIGSLLSPGRQAFSLHPAGIILSIVGSIVVLLILGSVRRRATV